MHGRRAGEAFYVKESGDGAEGWVAVGASGNGSNPTQSTALKQTTTTRSNTDELIDDPELTVPVEAGAVYKVEGFVIYDSATTADIRFGWAAPEGTDLRWTVNGPASATQAGGNTTLNRGAPATLSAQPPAGGAGVTDVAALPTGTLTVGETGGELTLQWAQRVAEASDTAVKRGSTLQVTRIG